MEEINLRLKEEEYFEPLFVELGDLNTLTFGAATGENDAGG